MKKASPDGKTERKIMNDDKDNSIAIISPSKSYPGGIYHYTTKTALELKKYFNVDVISFKRQYPKLLYPGNKKKDDYVDLNIDNVYGILNWYDYSSWKRAITIIKHNSKYIYIPWWTILLAIPFIFLAKLSKKNGIKVIIEFHNIFDHDAGTIKILFSSLLVRKIVSFADLCIVHTTENSEKLKKLIKAEINLIILPLGPLNGFREITPNEIFRIYKLNHNLKYILMFGIVRKYKGLEYAIEAMKYLDDPEYSDYRILVVGEIWININKIKHIIKKYGLEEKIIFIDTFIPDSHILPFFKISEIIIYPYTSATQSGSLNIAFSAKKPIIATNVGGFKETLVHGVNSLLIPPKDPHKLAYAILKLIENQELAKKIAENGNSYFKNSSSWNFIIEKMLNAIKI